MADIPEGSCGAGDGGSLLWIENWVEEYANYIFALGGGCARYTDGDDREEPGYNFYAYNISNNSWEPLTPIRYPVGEFVGNRFGFTRGHIYYWQGNKNYTKHPEYGNGTAFCMFEFESSPPPIFDMYPGTYPSIFGVHNGTITPAQTIVANKLYTYPCKGTGGHTEYIKIGNATWNATATWKGYKSDWHNVTFDKTVVLRANETYDYTIRTGSYPQIHHIPALQTASGWINCTEFVDANGKKYDNWIPAIRLE